MKTVKNTNGNSVADYLKSLNFQRFHTIKAMNRYLHSNFTPEFIDEFKTALDKREDLHGEDDMQFYRFKNASLQRSLAISTMFDYDYDDQMCTWIWKHKDLFHGTILEIGCDCGIFSCFLGKTFPDLKIVSIDVCSESVECAKQLAEKLNVTNVEFKNIALQNLDGQYDTLFSSKVLYDTYSCCSEELPVFSPLQKISGILQECMNPYAQQLRNHIKDNGTLISVERLSADPLLYAWLKALNVQKFNISEDYYGLINCKEGISGNNQFAILVSKADGSISPSDLLDFYYRFLLNDDIRNKKNPCHNWVASAFLHGNRGSLIEGYYGYNKKEEKTVKYAIWLNRNDSDAILSEVYVENQGYQITNCFSSILQESINSMHKQMDVYTAQGITFKRFQFINDEEVEVE